MATHGRKWRCRIRAVMIDFLVIHMDIFHMMGYQLSKNETDSFELDCERHQSRGLMRRRRSNEKGEREEKQQPTPLDRLLRLKKLAFIYHNFYMYFYMVELIRYILIDLISLEVFQNYQLLDCFILGRFRFIGRTNKISSHIAFVIISFIGIYRILAFYVLVSPWKFSYLEFLMYDHKQVVLEEVKFESSASQTSIASSTEPAPKSRGDPYLSRKVNLNPVFYLKSPFKLVHKTARFKPRSTRHDEWILRPNRTNKSWHFLETFTQCVIYASIAALLCWILLITRTIGGSIVTDLGFELGYPICASWIQLQQRLANLSLAADLSTSQPPYSWIYTSPRVLAGQMRIDDIPSFIPFNFLELKSRNAYHTTRIVLDIIDNQIWYADSSFFFCGFTYIFFMCSFDVVLNAAQINDRLTAIVSKLSQLREINVPTRAFMEKLHELEPIKFNYQGKAHLPLIGGGCGLKWVEQHEVDALSEEMATIQAILADHFDLVRGYNKFISLVLGLVLVSWCNYSLVMSIWMGSVRSTALEFEFVVAEIVGTFVVVLYFSGAAIARTLNYRLYSLIGRAMALDDDNSATKLRWINIMKFYSPRPRHCFTLLGSYEISSLLCLQFVWWILSAYIVLTKFFNQTRN